MARELRVLRLVQPVRPEVRLAIEDFDCTSKYPDDEVAGGVQEFLRSGGAERDDATGVATTYLAWAVERDGDGPKLAGYVTICAGALILNEDEKAAIGRPPFFTVGAVRIAMLGADARYKEAGRPGPLLVGYVAGLVRSLRERLAIRFVIADANEALGAVDFYERQGFIPNEEKKNRRSGTVSMRLDLLKVAEVPGDVLVEFSDFADRHSLTAQETTEVERRAQAVPDLEAYSETELLELLTSLRSGRLQYGEAAS